MCLGKVTGWESEAERVPREQRDLLRRTGKALRGHVPGWGEPTQGWREQSARV